MKIKEKSLTIRMTIDDYIYIYEKANNEDISMGEYIRNLLKKEKEN